MHATKIRLAFFSGCATTKVFLFFIRLHAFMFTMFLYQTNHSYTFVEFPRRKRPSVQDLNHQFALFVTGHDVGFFPSLGIRYK